MIFYVCNKVFMCYNLYNQSLYLGLRNFSLMQNELPDNSLYSCVSCVIESIIEYVHSLDH